MTKATEGQVRLKDPVSVPLRITIGNENIQVERQEIEDQRKAL